MSERAEKGSYSQRHGGGDQAGRAQSLYVDCSPESGDYEGLVDEAIWSTRFKVVCKPAGSQAFPPGKKGVSYKACQLGSPAGLSTVFTPGIYSSIRSDDSQLEGKTEPHTGSYVTSNHDPVVHTPVFSSSPCHPRHHHPPLSLPQLPSPP